MEERLVTRAEHEAIDAAARSFKWEPYRAADLAAIGRLPVSSLALAEVLDERRPGLKAPKEWSGAELAAQLDLAIEDVAAALRPLIALGLLHICNVVERDSYQHLFSLQPKLWLGQDPEYDALMGALAARVEAPVQAGTRQRLSPLAARQTAVSERPGLGAFDEVAPPAAAPAADATDLAR